MIGFIDNAFAHSRTVLATLLLILISGTMAYINVPKEADPDINIPIVYVQMKHDGISPEDAERLLIRPMEQELSGIEGVKEMTASGYEGGASVTLEFDAGFDADLAMSDVREKVDLAKPDLPNDTEEPTVHEVNFSLFPVLLVSLAGEVPERTLLRLARDLKDEVEAIATVLEVKIAGDREEMVEVLIDPIRVESYGLSPELAIDLVASSNLLVAAGAQDTGHGRFSLKVPGLFETTYDIMNLPISTDGDAVIKLIDIAEVRRTFKDPDSFARIDGRSALVLEVVKRSGENIIDTIENDLGWPLGGTGPSVSNIAHTQGWLHCNLPGSDAAGSTKALMDDLIADFTQEDLPNRVHISSSCCQINCASHGDISIIVQHHHAPRIDHANMQICELPKVVAICPAAAIRPKLVDGKESVEVVDEKCMYCGACYTACPNMPISDPLNDGISVWVGGKIANARSIPAFTKLAVAYLPNNPPRWPEAIAAVKNVVEVYRDNAQQYERLGEMIERIGWPKFFKLTGFEFTKYHIDDYKLATKTYNSSTHIRF